MPMHDILLAFIPMFFAMDPIGILPLYSGLTQGINPTEKKGIIFQSLITAVAVSVGFIFLGQVIFGLLGIAMGDFMIAGGAVLFCISIRDLIGETSSKKIDAKDMGAVPIGTPLIVGPAVLSMSLILISQFGLVPTLCAVLLNIFIVGILFIFENFFINLIGPSGARALSKVLALLLAAIGVMMIRRGLLEFLAPGVPS